MTQSHTEEGHEVKIDWYRGDKVDAVDHSVFYCADGVDEFGNEYEGYWEECCGEDEIHDVVCTTKEPQFVKKV